VRVLASSLLGTVLLMSGCAVPLGYFARQGSYLIRYSFGAKSAQAMIAEPSTPADTRAFLLRATAIRDFAVSSIGLKDSGNYTRYRTVDSDHLVDVVSACDAVSFTPYQWRYPFLGRLPYQGFYRRADADREATRLAAEGYDVIVRPVDAFSTLGLARDPLYSFMRDYSPLELAALIIHEQVHATLFVKGQPDFNEALATFVGDEGALEWIGREYGERSTEYASAIDARADADILAGLLRGLANELDTVYRGPGSRKEKLARKADILGAFTARFASERGTLFRTESYREARGDITINNAVLSQYLLYNDDVPLLRSYWERVCGGDLHRFVLSIRALAGHGDLMDLVRGALGDPR
jgi:predicted aminopeptidase